MLRFRFPRLAARTLCALACFPAWATPPLTTIQDMLYKANGQRFNGIAVVEWGSFEASDLSSIAANSLTLRIVDGVLRVQLVPTTNSRPTSYYTVRYNSDGKTQFTETWTVSSSVTPLRLRDVRTVAPGIEIGADTAPIQIGDVTGLADALEARPVRGPNYSPSRTAVIGPTGLLEGVDGDPGDCVKADGATAPCDSAPGFVDNETPGGAVNGVNPEFTLAAAPVPGSSLLLYRNGLLQKSGTDYTLAEGAITFASVATPQIGDILLASYRLPSPGLAPLAALRYRSSAGPGAAPAAQVLCDGNGNATRATSATSLAQCAIPSGTLQAGDRIEIRFDLAYSGATTGSTSATGAAGLRVDFLGRTAAATSETLALKHFLVLRYPAP